MNLFIQPDQPEASISQDATQQQLAAEAIAHDRWDDFKGLLAQGLDPEALDGYGLNALESACMGGAKTIATGLIEQGADPRKVGACGMDALEIALSGQRQNEPFCLWLWEQTLRLGPDASQARSHARAAIANGQEKLAIAITERFDLDVDAFDEIQGHQALRLDAANANAQGRTFASLLSIACAFAEPALFERVLAKSLRPHARAPGGGSAMALASRLQYPYQVRRLVERARSLSPQAAQEIQAQADLSAPPLRDALILAGELPGPASENAMTRQQALIQVAGAQNFPELLDLASRCLGEIRQSWGDSLRASAKVLDFWRACSFIAVCSDSGCKADYSRGQPALMDGAQTEAASLDCAKAILADILRPMPRAGEAPLAIARAKIKGLSAFFKTIPNAPLDADQRRRLAFDPFDATIHTLPSAGQPQWRSLQALSQAGIVDLSGRGYSAWLKNPPAERHPTHDLIGFRQACAHFGLGALRVGSVGGWSAQAQWISKGFQAFEDLAQKLPLPKKSLGFGSLHFFPGLPTHALRPYWGRIMPELPVMAITDTGFSDHGANPVAILGHEYAHILDFWSKANPDTPMGPAFARYKNELATQPRSELSAKLWVDKRWNGAVEEQFARQTETSDLAEFSSLALTRAQAELERQSQASLGDPPGAPEDHDLARALRERRDREALASQKPKLNAFQLAALRNDLKNPMLGMKRYYRNGSEMAARGFETLLAPPDPDRTLSGPELDRPTQALLDALSVFEASQTAPAARPLSPRLARKLQERQPSPPQSIEPPVSKR